jgi:hypothetical protein
MGSRRALLRFPFLFLSWFLAGVLTGSLSAQIIEFESGGLKYKTLTHDGVTVMFAPLSLHVRDYAVLQVSISNGSPVSWAARPEDFRFERESGGVVQASTARSVVGTMLAKAGRGDVTKLVTAYEAALYGNVQLHSTNGYESRRQSAMAEVGSTRLKAAAAASAIVLVQSKLLPGQSTDGGVFFANNGKPLGTGRLIVEIAGATFTFPVEPEVHPAR